VCRAFHCVTLLSQSFPAIPDNGTKLQSVTRFDSLSLQSAPKFYMAQNWHKNSCEGGECTSNASRDVIGERSTKKTKWREPLIEAVGWLTFSRCKLNETRA
jgi:hypothetical protein